MAGNWTVCGVCDFRNINKASVMWCSECDEGLCDECREHHGASKSTRNHATISITEYQKLPPNVLSITQTCQKHKEQYQTFCKKHDCPCCRRCVIETHNDCKDLKAIDDIVHNIKSSSAFLEVEQILAVMLENIQQIRYDRQTNIKCLQKQKRNIETKIHETRKMINVYLDQLHENVIKELYFIEENENKNIKQFLSLIEENERDITDLQFNLKNIKQHASELQAFLVLKTIEKEIAEKENFITSVVGGEYMKTKHMSLVVNKELQSIGRIPKFGSICVESKTSAIIIKGYRNQQVQVTIPIVISNSIDNIKVSKKMQFNLRATVIRGCTIFPNGKMIFGCQNERKLIIVKSNGTHDFEIKLDTAVCDIVYMESDNFLAVTSGCDQKPLIHIIDIDGRKVKKYLKVSSHPFGIAARNSSLVYRNSGTGIMEMTLNDECETTLVNDSFQDFSYVAVHNDKLYYTCLRNHSVKCEDIEGYLWEFMDPQKLQFPQGLAVDNDGNVYVASRDTISVVVISPDGQQCRQILSSSDGLSAPLALHFDRKSNKLLVVDQWSHVFLYDV